MPLNTCTHLKHIYLSGVSLGGSTNLLQLALISVTSPASTLSGLNLGCLVCANLCVCVGHVGSKGEGTQDQRLNMDQVISGRK